MKKLIALLALSAATLLAQTPNTNDVALTQAATFNWSAAQKTTLTWLYRVKTNEMVTFDITSLQTTNVVDNQTNVVTTYKTNAVWGTYGANPPTFATWNKDRVTAAAAAYEAAVVASYEQQRQAAADAAADVKAVRAALTDATAGQLQQIKTILGL